MVSGRWPAPSRSRSLAPSLTRTLALTILSLSPFLLFPPSLAAQTGGQFDLSHSVIASGGGSNSTGAAFNVSVTVGQHVAGVASNNSPSRFDLHGGFWFQNLAPTAAAVSITGRVTTSTGQGVRNVRLTLTAPNGARRTAITSTFGYYAFDGVEVGHTYVLEIVSKRYTFADPTRIFSLQDTVTDMDFIAEPL